jgi:hypothetical protein
MHTATLSPTIPPRRNELGAQLVRGHRLAQQALDCAADVAKLSLRFARAAAVPPPLAGPGGADPARQLAGALAQLRPRLELGAAYSREVAAQCAELQGAWLAWAQDTLCGAGEQLARLAEQQGARADDWRALGANLMRATAGAGLPTAPAVPAAQAAPAAQAPAQAAAFDGGSGAAPNGRDDAPRGRKPGDKGTPRAVPVA